MVDAIGSLFLLRCTLLYVFVYVFNSVPYFMSANWLSRVLEINVVVAAVFEENMSFESFVAAVRVQAEGALYSVVV